MKKTIYDEFYILLMKIYDTIIDNKGY